VPLPLAGRAYWWGNNASGQLGVAAHRPTTPRHRSSCRWPGREGRTRSSRGGDQLDVYEFERASLSQAERRRTGRRRHCGPTGLRAVARHRVDKCA